MQNLSKFIVIHEKNCLNDKVNHSLHNDMPSVDHENVCHDGFYQWLQSNPLVQKFLDNIDFHVDRTNDQSVNEDVTQDFVNHQNKWHDLDNTSRKVSSPLSLFWYQKVFSHE